MANILFVDDDPLIRHNLTTALSAAGYRIVLAASAAEGYAAALAGDFDLLLLDIGLPDESGVELARRLRRAKCPAPIIFLTAYGDEEFVKAAVDCQAHSYLVKPVATRQLLPVIETALASVKHQNEQRDKLLSALNNSREISTAVGMLAASGQLDTAAAFERLRRAARSRGMKIEILANEIIAGRVNPGSLT